MAASKPSAKQLITDNIDVWTSAIKKRGSQGRGSSKKIELYGIKKLRELILELAVRGLLVPQDPNDESASVLLEKIAAEKEQLIKDGKIKKEKPLPPIDNDERLFEIPNGWEWVRLGDGLCKITDGTHHSPANTDAGDFLYISAKNIKSDGVLLSNATFVTAEAHKEIYSRCNPEFGDVLYIKDGATTGIATINDIVEPFSMLSSVALLKCPDSILNTFLLLSLRSPYFYNEMRAGMSGVAITRVTLKKLKYAFICLPPLSEQKRIVAKVNELMALCDQLEQQTETSLTAHQTLVETLLNTLLTAAQTTPTNSGQESSSLTNSSLTNSFDQAWNRIAQHFDVLFTTEHSIDQLKQTILQLAVMGKLVPQDPNDEPASVLLEKIAAEKEQLIKDKKIKKQKALPPIGDDEKPFELPNGWEFKRLGDLAYVFAGNSFKSGDFNETGGTRVIKITNAGVGALIETEEYLPETFSENYKNYRVEEGDLVMALTRPYISNGLKVSSCPASYHNALLNQRVAAIRAFSNTQFLYQFMQSNFVLGLYRNRFGGSGLQPNLKMNDVTDLITPVPPETEQPKLVAKINELMVLCDSLKARISESQSIQLHLADAIAEQALN